MLSKKEKAEFIMDGRSWRRRKNFAQLKNLVPKDNVSFDEYIHFLMEIQAVFSPFAISQKKTITAHNKL